MPPSTRAGQTRRDERDDDQAAMAAGNGQEEGWLTQVEKIPKDISSSIAHIKKLSDSNWHTWEPTFINCLQQVHNTKEILYGDIAPGSEEYDEDLDKALDVIKLGKELDSIWNDAAHLGKHFDEDLKKSMLYCCTAQDWFYANSVDALKTAKPDCATHHMVNDERMLLTSMSKVGQISTAGDERLQVKAIGDTSLWVGDATIQLLDVLFVPKLNANLLSVQGLIENSAWIIFDEFRTTIKQNDGTQVHYRRNRRKGQFKVQGQALALELEEALNDVPEDDQNTGRQDNVPEDNRNTGDWDSYLWHKRFGHLGQDKTRQIWVHYLGTDERMKHKLKHCNACSQGKQTQAQMSQSELKRVGAPLGLVHIDLMTDFKGHANYHYALVAVDDFSSLIYMELLCTKGAALMALRRWITRME
ncbi:hypothetical protein NDA14_004938 [Ustilago hordei]|nr:hypothetical protein NDA14_004938 [Ustilago hordei]